MRRDWSLGYASPRIGELGMGNAPPVTAGLINRVVLRARPWLLQLYETEV